MSPGAPLHLNAPADDSDNNDTNSDASSVASFPPFSPSVGSSRTSNWDSSGAPASVLSMTSSLREAAFRQEYGRYLNNYSEVYRLPADEEELERLDKQHLSIMGMMGKYPPPMADVLTDDVPGEQKAVLDLGCGSGAWIMDVAREFPHCSAVAVDLIPMQNENIPLNCRSEVDDINLGLEHFYGDFNVVHARLIISGIKDYSGLIHHIGHVLRPGGLVQLTEVDYCVYDLERQPIELNLSRMEEPYFPRWFAFLKIAARGRGADVDAPNYFHSWVQEHGAFENIVYRVFWLPICPWFTGTDPETKWWNTVGETTQDSLLTFLKAGRTLLLGSGLEEDFVNELQEKSTAELVQCKYTGLLRMQSIYALKKQLQLES